jgi:hypothetical protein
MRASTYAVAVHVALAACVPAGMYANGCVAASTAHAVVLLVRAVDQSLRNCRFKCKASIAYVQACETTAGLAVHCGHLLLQQSSCM